MKSERQRQLEAVANSIRNGGIRKEWAYLCDDGEEFRAIACTESGAFRVLNAERPGMRARLINVTS